MIKLINIDLLEYIKQFDKKEYVIVHCISNDWALGKGIAKTLDSRFNIKKYKKSSKVNDCIIVNCDDTLIANLITKEKYYMKPTYDTLFNSIDNLLKQVSKEIILIMPKIGCGLDKLDWQIVYSRLQLLDYDIRVCYL